MTKFAEMFSVGTSPISVRAISAAAVFSSLPFATATLSIPTTKRYMPKKIMIVEENQVTPYHYHRYKQEDIINRGGGNLMIKVYGADENDNLSDEDVEIQVDGRHYTVPAGTVVRLTPA